MGGCSSTPTSRAEPRMEGFAEIDSFKILDAEIRRDIANELLAQKDPTLDK